MPKYTWKRCLCCLSFLGYIYWFEGATVTAVEPEYLSHPPLRRMLAVSDRPMGKGPAFYADALKGNDAGDGSERQPWKTINHALKQLTPGDTLVLRAGAYFENVYCAVAGRPDAPITIRSAPGERVVIDGGLPEFQVNPAIAWQSFPGGAGGEYVSTHSFRNIRDVVGLFGDSNIGLQTYWEIADLRAANEFWIPDPKTMIKPIYCGPGLWYDKQAGLIHVRLAHTHIKPSAEQNYPDVNYAGETDPRKLPLVVAPFNSVPLFVDQAMHVRFQDLVVRGGGYRTIHLNFGVDLEFDNCTIYCGTYGIWTKGTGPLKMTNCGVYGMIPPWGTRDENSLFVYLPNKSPPFIPDEKGARHISRLPTHALMVPAGGFEFEVFYYPYDHDWDISNCEFTDSHDGVYLAGYNIRFHHNWIDTLQDDGIYISSPTWSHTHSVRIYQNYISSGITAFGQHARGGPGGNIYIYRNVIDLRKPLQYWRPTEKNPEGRFNYGHSVLFMHGSSGLLTEEAIHFYHNTCLLRSIYFAGNAYGFMLPNVPRRVFNNLFLYTQDKAEERGLQVGDTAKLDLAMDGNLHWNILKGGDSSEAYLRALRALPLSESGRTNYPGGFEAHAVVADPKCKNAQWDKKALNDYRLQQDSPAIGRGVGLAKEYEDPFRPADGRAPDIGAIPASGEPLRVGIHGRITAGILRRPE